MHSFSVSYFKGAVFWFSPNAERERAERRTGIVRFAMSSFHVQTGYRD
jgi:hypothetical protein